MSESVEKFRERIEVLDQGRITIPKKIREELGIKDGSILEICLLGKKIILELRLK